MRIALRDAVEAHLSSNGNVGFAKSSCCASQRARLAEAISCVAVLSAHSADPITSDKEWCGWLQACKWLAAQDGVCNDVTWREEGQRQSWLHPALQRSDRGTRHDVGLCCVGIDGCGVPAGTLLLVDPSPLVHVTTHNDGRNNGSASALAVEGDGTAAYERRFIAAVESMKQSVWDPLVRLVGRCDRGSQSSSDDALVCRNKECIGSKLDSIVTLTLRWLRLAALGCCDSVNDAEQPMQSSGATVAARVIDFMCDAWQKNAMRVHDTYLCPSRSNPSSSVSATEEDYGYALYFNGSFVNHSCRPNGVAIFAQPNTSSYDNHHPARSRSNVTLAVNSDQPVLTIRAIRDVEIGEEITISYTPLFCSRRDVASRNGFTCTCPERCGDAAQLVSHEGVLCFSCRKFIACCDDHASDCHVVAPGSDELQRFEAASAQVVAKMKAKCSSVLAAAQHTNLSETLRSLTRLLSACDGVLSKFHWVRHDITLSILAVALSTANGTQRRDMVPLEIWVDVLHAAERTLAVAERFFAADLSSDNNAALLPCHPLLCDLMMCVVFCRGVVAERTAVLRRSMCQSDDGDHLEAADPYDASQMVKVVASGIRKAFACHAASYFGFGCDPDVVSPSIDWIVPSSYRDEHFTTTFMEKYAAALEVVGIRSTEDLARMADENGMD